MQSINTIVVEGEQELSEGNKAWLKRVCLSLQWWCWKALVQMHHIYPAIRQDFSLSQMTSITKSVIWNFAIIQVLPFLNNPNNLDPSYKMDLDFWDCFGRKKFCLITEEIWYMRATYDDCHPHRNWEIWLSQWSIKYGSKSIHGWHC